MLMAKRTRITIEQMTGTGIFDMFEPMRKVGPMLEKVKKELGIAGV